SILHSQQQSVVKRSVISGDGRPDAAHDLEPVWRKQRGSGKITAIRVERNSVRMIQGPDELANGILREDESSKHGVNCIDEGENLRPRYRRRRPTRQFLSRSRDFGRMMFHWRAACHWRRAGQSPGDLILFSESSDLFLNSVLKNREIARPQA